MNQSGGSQERSRKIWTVVGIVVVGIVFFAINRMYHV